MILSKYLSGVLREGEPAPAGGGGPALTGDEVERLKAALRAPVAAPPAAPPAGAAPPALSKQELEQHFWKNPLEISAAIAQQAAASASANGLDTQTEMARNLARGDKPEEQAIWDKFFSEIEAMVNTSVQPQFRTNVTVWRNAFNFVKGQHVDDIIKMRTPDPAAGAPAVRTSDGPASPSVRAPAATPKSKLSDEEKFVLKGLGISEDGYRHGKEIIERQHGKDESPWDAVITIDNSRSKPNARSKQPAA